MILIVGLGNPGKKYEKTWHNIGFRAIDYLKSLRSMNATRSSPRFAPLELANLKRVILAKPKTFMNLSGKAIKFLIAKYKIAPANLLVIHDDIDLPLGKFKIQKNRGSAGHKGVQSIINEIKTKNFTRIRIGIQPEKGRPKNIEKFVLKKFNKKEEEIIKEIFGKIIEAITVAKNQ